MERINLSPTPEADRQREKLQKQAYELSEGIKKHNKPPEKEPENVVVISALQEKISRQTKEQEEKAA